MLKRPGPVAAPSKGQARQQVTLHSGATSFAFAADAGSTVYLVATDDGLVHQVRPSPPPACAQLQLVCWGMPGNLGLTVPDPYGLRCTAWSTVEAVLCT